MQVGGFTYKPVCKNNFTALFLRFVLLQSTRPFCCKSLHRFAAKRSCVLRQNTFGRLLPAFEGLKRGVTLLNSRNSLKIVFKYLTIDFLLIHPHSYIFVH